MMTREADIGSRAVQKIPSLTRYFSDCVGLSKDVDEGKGEKI